MKTPKYSLLSNVRFVLLGIWKYRPSLFALSTIAALCSVALPFLGILLPKIVLENLQEGNVRALLQNIGLIGAGLALVGGLQATLQSKVNGRLDTVRLQYFLLVDGKHMSCDYQLLESPAYSDLKGKATRALWGGDRGVGAVLYNGAQLMANTLGIIAYGSMLFVVHPLMVLGLILLSFAHFATLRAAQHYEDAQRDSVAPIDRKLDYFTTQAQKFSAAKDVRLYGMAKWFSALHLAQIKLRSGFHFRIAKRNFGAQACEAVTGALRDALAYAYLIYRVLNGMPVSDFIFYIGLVAGFSTWMAKALSDASFITRASDAVSHLRAYLTTPDSQSPENPLPAPKGKLSIVLENVSFYYPNIEKPVIEDMNLTISAGEKLALVGINGAGKTTLVKLLTGLYTPTKGRILIGGVDSAKLSHEDRYKLFSVVFQDTPLIAFPLHQNVALCPPEKIDKQRVEHCLRLSGLLEDAQNLPNGIATSLTKALEEDGVELSGGQTQKLMLARALYKDAPIVILDEPTAALDPLAEYEMYCLYNEMIGEKTSLFISHRLSSTRFCNRIILLDDGVIAETGTHEQLLAQGGKYAHMFNVQSHYYQQKEGAEDVA